MKGDSFMEDVEKCIQVFKSQLQEEQLNLQEDEKRVLNLLSAFYKKDSPKEKLDTLDQMKISFPNKSAINSLFQEEDNTDNFLFKLGQESKRKQLAAERRAEYNAYLEKKERELQSRRKVLEESQNVTPRSILEFVDYEKVLAKRKEEESRFRNLNYAEPNLDKGISKPEISVKENVDFIAENPKPYVDLPSTKKALPSGQRTGGGGEPVRDSSGNLITNRRFGVSSPTEYFPFQQDFSKQKKDFYREELRKQIEEKKRLAEQEKAQARLLEDQIAQRIEQQRKQMQMEYESELKKNNLVKEQLQQERLQRLEEFQRQDAEMRRRREREVQKTEKPKEPEPVQELSPPPKRSTSPPVPSVRSKVILERISSPVLATKTQVLSEVKPENIFSSLTEIRRTIMQEQQNLRKDMKDSYEVMNRRTVRDVVDDSDDLLDMSYHTDGST